jgi:serine/threonine protein kinase
MKNKLTKQINGSGTLYDTLASIIKTIRNKHKIIGYGEYGCVVYPPIKTNLIEIYQEYENKHKKDVGKLFKISNDSRNEFMQEMHNLELTNLFDPSSIFTIRMKGANTLNSENVEDHIRQCLGVSYRHEYIYQIILENGGQSLDKIKSRSISFAKFVKLVKHFIEGFSKMQSFGLCHRDIKPDNVLISEDKINLIDFGVSDELKNVFSPKNKIVLQHKSSIYPPEFFVSSLLLDFKSNKKAFLAELANVIPEMEYQGYFETLFNENYIDAVKEELEDFISNIKINNLGYADVFNSEMAKKCDIFSLFTIFEELSDKVIITNEIQQRQIKALVMKCRTINPYERATIEDISDILNDMQESYDSSTKGGGNNVKFRRYLKFPKYHKSTFKNSSLPDSKNNSLNIIRKRK